MVEGGPFERRAVLRSLIRGRASVAIECQRSFRAATIDISEAGICLTAPVALEPGTVCRLDVEIEQPLLTQFTVNGRVCFCIGERGHYRVGFHCPALALLNPTIASDRD